MRTWNDLLKPFGEPTCMHPSLLWRIQWVETSWGGYQETRCSQCGELLTNDDRDEVREYERAQWIVDDYQRKRGER